MPIYEYQCEACAERFDKLFVSLSRIPTEIACPVCQSTTVRRLISAPTIHTAGEGGQAEIEPPPPSKPPVFGRKELNEALKKKKQLAEE